MPIKPISLLSLILLAGSANANMLDLTGLGSSGEINGAQFFQFSADIPTGTGVFNPFLRVQQNAVERGYNTDGALEFDAKAGAWTHAIQLKDIPLINGYRQFTLDMNESIAKSNSLLSLDKVQLFITSDAKLSGYNTSLGSFFSGATKVYDMDSPAGSPLADNWVKLDNKVSGSGSGRADMLMYVPDAYFTSAGANVNSYVVMYSLFGTVYGADGGLTASAGFEEWSATKFSGTDIPVPPNSVPVPAAVWLLGSGLVGLIGVGARKRK